MLKKALKVFGVLVLLVVVIGGGFVFSKLRAFDAEKAKVWEVPLADVRAPDLKAAAAAVAAGATGLETPPVAQPSDGTVLAAVGEAVPAVDAAAKVAELNKNIAIYQRGKHLAQSLGGCNDCHGEDYGSPRKIEFGPVGTVHGPNITMGGLLQVYSDAELHRLLVHGIKRDGTTAIFMPSADFRWFPDEDIMAIVGFLRTAPPSNGASGVSDVKPLGKILDRTDKLPLLIAPRLAGKPREIAPQPAPTAEYGKFVANLCMGCHGGNLAGGPIPGAPPELPIPSNITKDATGIAHYDFAKFDTLMRTAKKPDGSALDPFMPVLTLKNFDEIEMRALWEYLQSVEAVSFGQRVERL